MIAFIRRPQGRHVYRSHIDKSDIQRCAHKEDDLTEEASQNWDDRDSKLHDTSICIWHERTCLLGPKSESSNILMNSTFHPDNIDNSDRDVHTKWMISQKRPPRIRMIHISDRDFKLHDNSNCIWHEQTCLLGQKSESPSISKNSTFYPDNINKSACSGLRLRSRMCGCATDHVTR